MTMLHVTAIRFRSFDSFAKNDQQHYTSCALVIGNG